MEPPINVTVQTPPSSSFISIISLLIAVLAFAVSLFQAYTNYRNNKKTHPNVKLSAMYTDKMYLGQGDPRRCISIGARNIGGADTSIVSAHIYGQDVMINGLNCLIETGATKLTTTYHQLIPARSSVSLLVEPHGILEQEEVVWLELILGHGSKEVFKLTKNANGKRVKEREMYRSDSAILQSRQRSESKIKSLYETLRKAIRSQAAKIPWSKVEK